MTNLSDIIFILILLFSMLMAKAGRSLWDQNLMKSSKRNFKEMTLKVSVFVLIAVGGLWGFEMFYLLRGNHG